MVQREGSLEKVKDGVGVGVGVGVIKNKSSN